VGGAPVQVTANRLVDEKQRARMDEAVKLLGGELRLAYDSPAAGEEANRTYHEELRREIERLAKQGGPVMAKAAVEGTKGLVMATIAAYQEPPEKSVLEKAYEREGADNANGRNAP
jgi:hypothetical protein